MTELYDRRHAQLTFFDAADHHISYSALCLVSALAVTGKLDFVSKISQKSKTVA